MNIGIAQIIQESNTFSPFKTQLKEFYHQYYYLGKDIYNKCVDGFKKNISEEKNNVKDFYRPFSHKEISKKIAEILKSNKIKADLDVIFQEINGLHKACPENLGDWYFTGNYPTPGGNRVVNRAFMNYYEGKSQRAY